MTARAKNNPPVVEAIPDPAAIRNRLDELRTEARILSKLLPVSEQAQRMATKAVPAPVRLSADPAHQGGQRK